MTEFTIALMQDLDVIKAAILAHQKTFVIIGIPVLLGVLSLTWDLIWGER